jgi:hypothetical protein
MRIRGICLALTWLLALALGLGPVAPAAYAGTMSAAEEAASTPDHGCGQCDGAEGIAGPACKLVCPAAYQALPATGMLPQPPERLAARQLPDNRQVAGLVVAPDPFPPRPTLQA